MKRSLIICFLVIGLSLSSVDNTQGKSPELNITGWKIYTNKNYGYQINHPQKWEEFVKERCKIRRDTFVSGRDDFGTSGINNKLEG